MNINYRIATHEFINAVSDTGLDMINFIFHVKTLIFIKAVSDTVLNMINLIFHDKPLVFIGALQQVPVPGNERHKTIGPLLFHMKDFA